MNLKAYAKLNLTLDILGKRDDGYHELSSVMQEIEIADELHFEILDTQDVLFECNIPGLQNQDNLVVRAALLLQEVFQLSRGAKITLTKNIPVGAGLGGGSSDAASALKGLSDIWGLHLGTKDLLKLASELGSDVPFFIEGNTCLVRGRGEFVLPIEAPSFFYVLVVPDFPIRTPEAYALFDRAPRERVSRSTEELLVGFEPKKFHNDFEGVIARQHPKVAAIKEKLLKAGAGNALLTGSGSGVFGVFANQESAKIAFDALKGDYPKTYQTMTRQHS
ncbi:4-(cytidine 5'-diphospho)-2-C-methyl-D-erythritol kinase [Candidatus Woesearchaeota archaeon]|nr:4-(cytidine 5'-diphospho)-2-C-methyl-D-erythritol kinase [Candidatus Woesearchaeota archaeon]